MVKSTSRVATRCISIRDSMSFQRASWRKASTGMSPSSSRLMRSSRLRLNCRGDALGIVIGREQPVDRLHPVHADQQLGAGTEQVAEMRAAGRSRSAARNCRWSSRGRSRASAARRCRAGSANGRAKSATTGRTVEIGEALAEARRALSSDSRRKCRSGHRRRARSPRAATGSWSPSRRRTRPPPRPRARARRPRGMIAWSSAVSVRVG